MRTKRVVLTAISCLFTASPVLAHHSLQAHYELNRPITIKGTITKIVWSNPHTHLYLEAKEENGGVGLWELEMASPNMLMLNGWKFDSFRQGDHITVSAYPSRDGSKLGYAKQVTKNAR